jgi:polynucleotide 5'-hydroxyl-kinase GRC3/NOL9
LKELIIAAVERTSRIIYDKCGGLMSTKIIPEPVWKILFKRLTEHKGISVIIGATDSGKSTLVRYLIDRFISGNIKVCLVDSDVGQSSLGLPGTISMKLFVSENDLEDFRYEKMSFVGTLNPAKNIASIIKQTKRLSDFCREKSYAVLVDTSGLISGEAGKALKDAKIRALKPQHVIAIRRRDELEHILKVIERPEIHRIKASAAAKTRSITTRTQYRKRKFDDYFSKAASSDFLLHTNEARFLYRNRAFRPEDGLFKQGTLIGLNHEEDTMSLGILEEMTDASVTFRSPIKSIKKINRILFGDVSC